MSYQDIRRAKAIEQANKNKFLKVNPELDDGSGIYILLRTDENGIVCKEMVVYTLFKMIPCDGGSCGEEVIEGHLKIEWDNSLMED